MNGKPSLPVLLESITLGASILRHLSLHQATCLKSICLRDATYF